MKKQKFVMKKSLKAEVSSIESSKYSSFELDPYALPVATASKEDYGGYSLSDTTITLPKNLASPSIERTEEVFPFDRRSLAFTSKERDYNDDNNYNNNNNNNEKARNGSNNRSNNHEDDDNNNNNNGAKHPANSWGSKLSDFDNIRKEDQSTTTTTTAPAPNTHNVTVFKAINKSNQASVQLYAYSVEEFEKDEIEAQIKSVVDLCNASPHPNILEHYNYFEVSAKSSAGYGLGIIKFYVVCKDIAATDPTVTSLKSELDKQTHINETLLLDWMLQVTLALEHIHKHGIIHKHVQPHNVLLTDHRKTVKLACFGFENYTEDDNEYFYVAPEVLDEQKYSPKADIFSMGIMFLKLTTLRDYDIKYNNDVYFPRLTSDIKEKYSGVIADLIQSCLHDDPNQRPAASVLSQRLRSLKREQSPPPPPPPSKAPPQPLPPPAQAPAPVQNISFDNFRFRSKSSSYFEDTKSSEDASEKEGEDDELLIEELPKSVEAPKIRIEMQMKAQEDFMPFNPLYEIDAEAKEAITDLGNHMAQLRRTSPTDATFQRQNLLRMVERKLKLAENVCNRYELAAAELSGPQKTVARQSIKGHRKQLREYETAYRQEKATSAVQDKSTSDLLKQREEQHEVLAESIDRILIRGSSFTIHDDMELASASLAFEKSVRSYKKGASPLTILGYLCCWPCISLNEFAHSLMRTQRSLPSREATSIPKPEATTIDEKLIISIANESSSAQGVSLSAGKTTTNALFSLLDSETSATQSKAKQYKIVKRVAKGGQGVVFLVEHVGSKQQFAMKRCTIEHEHDLYEVDILRSFPMHDNIIAFIDYFMIKDENYVSANNNNNNGGGGGGGSGSSNSSGTSSLSLSNLSILFTYYLNMVMEFCAKGDLGDYIRRRKANSRYLTPQLLLRFVRQITQGVEVIHKQNFVHFDLKPANIFISQNDSVKIGDFGLARRLVANPEAPHSGSPAGSFSYGFSGSSSATASSSSSSAANPNSGNGCGSGSGSGGSSMMITVGGTIHYMSPEQSQGKKCDFASDIWSLGCVVLEMLTLTRRDVKQDISKNPNFVEDLWKEERMGERYDEAFLRYLQACLVMDPAKRASATVLLAEVLPLEEELASSKMKKQHQQHQHQQQQE